MTPTHTPALSERLRRQHFARIALALEDQTSFMSSSHDMKNTPSYQELIAMGEHAIPLILQVLKAAPAVPFFLALKTITTVDPVPESARGNIAKMAHHWLEWGHAKGHI